MGNIEFFTKEEKKLLEKKQQKWEISAKEYGELLSASKEKIEQEEEISKALDNLEQETLDLETKLQKKIELLRRFIQKKDSLETKAKKEAEKQWFSWEKISKDVKENWGWFSIKGLKAWVVALVWGIFSWLFGWIKEQFEGLFYWIQEQFNKAIGWIEEKASNIADTLTNSLGIEKQWTFQNNEYLSNKKNFKIKFHENGTISNVIIWWQEYIPSRGYKLKKEKWKYFLIGWNNIPENKFSLDYLWGYFDNSNIKWEKDIYTLEEKSLQAIDILKWHIMPDFFRWEIKFRKKESLPTAEWKIITAWETKIVCATSIDKQDYPIKDVKIQEIIIKWDKYKVSCSWCNNLKFNIEKDWEIKILNYIDAFPDLKIDIMDIQNRITSENAVPDTPNKYYLFDQLLTEEELKKYASFSKLFTKIIIDSKKFYRPDIYLEKI